LSAAALPVTETDWRLTLAQVRGARTPRNGHSGAPQRRRM